MNFLQKLISYFFDPSQEDSFWSAREGAKLIEERKIDDQGVVPSMDTFEETQDNVSDPEMEVDNKI